jgi:hypothetical protein
MRDQSSSGTSGDAILASTPLTPFC